MPTRPRGPQSHRGGRGPLLFLPAYSPDFNPIELAFAKVKEHLRAAAKRTPEGWSRPPHAAIDAVSTTMPGASMPIVASPSRPINMRTGLEQERHGEVGDNIWEQLAGRRENYSIVL